MKNFILLLVLGLASFVSFASDAKDSNNTVTTNAFEFALIGDVAYDVNPGLESPSFDKLVSKINQQTNLEWVLFAGDMKSGGSPCSDVIYQDRFKRFNEFNKPFIMTFGDNEWTDCHRVSAGEYQPLERLQKLRKIFFAKPGETLGKSPMKLVTQASTAGFENYSENVRWEKGNVVFFTLHIVGSNNAKDDFDRYSKVERTSADDSEVIERTNAAIAWMKSSFDLAKQHEAAAVFLMIHANPGFDFFILKRDGFESFVNTLHQLTRDFAKPVVLAHGDTHDFKVDNPGLGRHKALPNFTRVETFGETNDRWIKVVVDPTATKMFRFEEQRID